MNTVSASITSRRLPTNVFTSRRITTTGFTACALKPDFISPMNRIASLARKDADLPRSFMVAMTAVTSLERSGVGPW